MVTDEHRPHEKSHEAARLSGRSTDAPQAPRRRRPRNARKQHLSEALAVFMVGFAAMLVAYGRPVGPADAPVGLPGHDSFYHVKMAALLPEHGLLRDFPWLKFVYFTYEGHDFVSHHYGFHALLAPFVHLSKWLTGDYMAGGRWAMAFFHGLTLVLFDLILLSGRVRWRWLWLMMFFLMPNQFFVRHAYVRAIGPSLVCMLLILALMFRRRAVLTGVAVAAFTHLYLGGVLYAPLIVGTFALAAIAAPKQQRSFPSRIVLFATAGWLVGVLTHPYAGGMADFLRLQVFGSGLSPDIPVGREWRPYSGVWWFAWMSGTLLIVWAVALCVRVRSGRPLSTEGMTLLLLNFIFLGLTFKARRFIEYWPVFATLSAAYLAAPLFATWVARLNTSYARRSRAWLHTLGGGATLVIAGAIVVWSPPWSAIRDAARCQYNLAAIEDAMRFLVEDSAPGDVVFTDDWDIFPVFFYYNAHNHYIVGLDPKFTQFRRPELWERYVRISRGQAPTTSEVKITGKDSRPHTGTIRVTLEDIRNEFGARYVVVDRDHRGLADDLFARPALATLVYPPTAPAEAPDAAYLIFRIAGRDQS